MLSKVGALEKNENKTRKRRADHIGEAGGRGRRVVYRRCRYKLPTPYAWIVVFTSPIFISSRWRETEGYPWKYVWFPWKSQEEFRKSQTHLSQFLRLGYDVPQLLMSAKSPRDKVAKDMIRLLQKEIWKFWGPVIGRYVLVQFRVLDGWYTFWNKWIELVLSSLLKNHWLLQVSIAKRQLTNRKKSNATSNKIYPWS